MSKLRTLRMRGEGQTITINKKIILLSHLKAETCFLDKHRSGDFDYISISALLSFAHSHALGEITTKRYQKANLDKDEASPEFIFSMLLSSIWWSKQTLCKHHISAKVCLTTSTTCSIELLNINGSSIGLDILGSLPG